MFTDPLKLMFKSYYCYSINYVTIYGSYEFLAYSSLLIYLESLEFQYLYTKRKQAN